MILLISEAIIILAADQPDRIRASSAKWGRLAIRYDRSDQILRVAGSSETTGEMITNPALRYIRANMAGVWWRVVPGCGGSARAACVGRSYQLSAPGRSFLQQPGCQAGVTCR